MKAPIVSGIARPQIALAVPAEAGVDMDIANQVHRHGSGASRDDTALLDTIVCERLYQRLDFNADRSAEFLSGNLRGTTQANEPVLRSSDNTKCGNRFHDLQDDSMEDR